MENGARITASQLELLKMFRFLKSEEEIEEVKQVLRNYFQQKLETEIERVEKERGYTKETYEQWLEEGA